MAITGRKRNQRSHPDISKGEASLRMSSDMEGITGSILLLCLISLANANTSPVISSVLFNVCEDIPIGQTAFTIQATDTENDPLTYVLTGPNAVFFSVALNTGIVTVERKLDRESADVMQLGVEVSDGISVTPGLLTIVILEANDNKPIFQAASYDAEVAENTAIGTSLFTVLATDADTGTAGVVQYSIDEVTPPDGTSLFSIVKATGEVRLAGQLNYTAKSTFYRLKIRAFDGVAQCHGQPANFSSFAFSFITVVDVPDLDPQFINLPYVGRVEENSPVGSPVFKVTAIDQDTGVNDAIIYTIEDSTADGLFEISRDSGQISVSSAIDREVTGDTVTLTVKATESKSSINGRPANTTASVQINIIDINDNKPEFYKCGPEDCVKATQFTGEVTEHSLGSVPINMMVKDLDKIPHTIELSLEGPDKDVFSVEPSFMSSDSLVQLLVKQPEVLDFEEKQQMTLEVVAVDKEKPSFRSTASVTINIKDANDNSPKFLNDTYKLTVAEHSPVGTTVATITAEDPDTMDQGKITYRLLPDSILPYFDVKPNTGVVYVKSETLLDREIRSLYSATLQARDTSGKPGTTVLEITVTDINDKHPVFNRDSYLVFVKEGAQFNIKIEATDVDDPETVNSQIVYGIVPSKYSGNFIIDPSTGVLRNKGVLDREALDPKLNGEIKINVTATDKGTPPLSSEVTVIINIEDVNDNTPSFEPPTYKFSVKEGNKGAFVGSVYAEDMDQTTEYNRISFSIIDGSFGSFIIRTFADGEKYRGNITVDPDIELDYESPHKQFRLQVEATDLEQRKAVAMVEVDVLDVNDERPEFKPTPPVTVKENTTISGAVGSFTAQDKDGNHSLVYELESIQCRCNGSMNPLQLVYPRSNRGGQTQPEVQGGL
uniref:Cadherin domain-containing protein n=1 Tax=Lates calcarifer TaxID=8187 RepID=A0A4W6CUD7_LATCA